MPETPELDGTSKKNDIGNGKTYQWPYKWETGVITLLSGFITSIISGRGLHLVNIKKQQGG